MEKWRNIKAERKKSRKRDHIMIHISVMTLSNVVVAFDVPGKSGKDNEILRSHMSSAISAKKWKLASRARGKSLTSQRLDESVSWVGYNLSLVPRAYHEFGVTLPFGG